MLFVQLKRARLVGARHYAAGSVVAVEPGVRKRLVEAGEASDHSGPASEPEASIERQRKPETADLRAKIERATSRD